VSLSLGLIEHKSFILDKRAFLLTMCIPQLYSRLTEAHSNTDNQQQMGKKASCSYL
jgi:hypothetical protein